MAIPPPQNPSRQAQESSAGLTNHPKQEARSTLCSLCTFLPCTQSGQQSLRPASKALFEVPGGLYRPLPFIPLIHSFIHSPLNPSIYFRDQGDLRKPASRWSKSFFSQARVCIGNQYPVPVSQRRWKAFGVSLPPFSPLISHMSFNYDCQ